MPIEVLTISTDYNKVHTRTTRAAARRGTTVTNTMDGIGRARAVFHPGTGHTIDQDDFLVIRDSTAPYTRHFEGRIENTTIADVGGVPQVTVDAISNLGTLAKILARPQVFEAQGDDDIILGLLSDPSVGFENPVFRLGNFFGQMQANATNSFLWSEDFGDSGDASWTKARTTITDNDAESPDGTTTADKLVDTTDNDTHILGGSLSGATDNTVQACSVFLKPDEITQATLQIVTKAGNGRSVTFDLSDGSWVSDSGSVGFFGRDIGGGWFRYEILADIESGATAPAFNLYLTKAGATTYIGNGTDGFHVWGMQWEKDQLHGGPYVKTTTVAASITNVKQVLASTDFAVGQGVPILTATKQVARAGGGHLYERAGQIFYTDQPGADASPWNLSDAYNGTTTRAFIDLRVSSDRRDIQNSLTVIGGTDETGTILTSTVSDATSITAYQERTPPPYRVPQISQQAFLDDIAAAILAKKKDPITSAACKVTDDGLDVNTTIDVTSVVHDLTAETYLISEVGLGVLSSTKNVYSLKLGPNNRRADLLLDRVNASQTAGALPASMLGITFSTASSEYLDFTAAEVPTAVDDLNASGLSLSFWFVLNETATAEIIDKDNGWYVQVFHTAGIRRLLFGAKSTGSDRTWRSDVELETGQVYHCVMTWNGGDGATDVVIKVNGAGGIGAAAGSGTITSEGDTGLEIARDHASGYFGGWIRDFCLWSGVMGVTDQVALFNDRRGSVPSSIMVSNQLVRLRMDYKTSGSTLGTGEIVDSWGSLSAGDGVNTPTQAVKTFFPVA